MWTEQTRNTQDNYNKHTSIHGHSHLPKMTTDHRRDINIFNMSWKKEPLMKSITELRQTMIEMRNNGISRKILR